MSERKVYARSAEVPAKVVGDVAQLVVRARGAGDASAVVEALTSGRYLVVLGVTRVDGEPLTEAEMTALAGLA